MEQPPQRSDCPLNVALERLGDRWSLAVLRAMILDGKRRHDEFVTAVPGITNNVLTGRLRRLERHGLVEKIADPEHRKAGVYLPTDEALDLMPVLLELIRWGLKHEPGSQVPPELEHCLRHGCHDLLIATRTQVMAERQELLRRAAAS